VSGKVSRAEVSAERKVSAERESEPSGRLSLLLCFPSRRIGCLAVRNPRSNELFDQTTSNSHLLRKPPAKSLIY
jgi:hypothetical protein